MTQNNQQKLREYSVIPDVLSVGTQLPYSLKVKFPNATLDEPGQQLARDDTLPEPKLYLTPAPKEARNDYVLILTDPDLMETNDRNFGQVRHWLSTNVAVNPDGELVVHSKTPYDVSPYIPPSPLPNYVSPRPHRYTFILAHPSSSSADQLSISAEDFQKLQALYPAALKGAQNPDVQDMKDRWGFNAQRFLKMKNLEVEAVTFMLVGGNLKSAATNMMLTGQAIVDKALGR